MRGSILTLFQLYCGFSSKRKFQEVGYSKMKVRSIFTLSSLYILQRKGRICEEGLQEIHRFRRG